MKSPEFGSFPEKEPSLVKEDIVYGPGVVVFDMDGLLETGKKNIWERLAARQGISDVFKKLKEEYINNRNLRDRKEWVTLEVGALIKSGLTKRVVDEEVSSQSLDMRVKELVPELNAMGYKTAIATGGLKALAELAKGQFGIDEVMALCDFIYDDRGLLVDWKYEPCDYEGKVNALWEIARNLRVPHSRIVYVGHGANDRPAFFDAPLSISVADINRKEWSPGAMHFAMSVMDIVEHIPFIPEHLRDPKTLERRIKSRENLTLPLNAGEKFAEGLRSLCESIDEKLKEKKDGTIFVMIAGRTGSGKTEKVTRRLKTKYREKFSALSIDNYFKGQSFIEEMKREGIDINRDHPLYMDFALLNKHLSDLSEGKAIDRPTFDYEKSERGGHEDFSPNRILGVEGTFALRPEMQDFKDRGIKVFVDVSSFGGIMRRIPRDIIGRKDKDPAQALLHYLSVAEPMYQEYVEPTRGKADLIIVNEYDPLTEVKHIISSDMQVKFKVDNLPKTMRLLEDNGAMNLGRAYQHDLYFTLKGEDALSSDNLIRLRTDRLGEGSLTRFFTCQGRMDEDAGVSPWMKGGLDKEQFDIVFDRYKEKGVKIAKQRKTYALDGLLVNLDEVSQSLDEHEENQRVIGYFIDIKIDIKMQGSSDEERIKNFCRKVGFSYDERITDSYIEMVRKLEPKA